MSDSIELWVPLRNTWFPALSIPIANCYKFSLYPLKWVRYVGYVIVGCMGTLSGSSDRNAPPIDYGVKNIPPGAYYYHLDDEPQFLDPLCMDEMTTEYQVNPTDSHFRSLIVARDRTCVLSGGTDMHCVAAHLVPHSKGDEYIEWLTRTHGRCGETITDIDDPKNGLLLLSSFHREIELCDMALLKTPNFALSETDIAPGTTTPHGRLTVNYFEDTVMMEVAPQGADVRLPLDKDLKNWPTDAIFEALYGVVVLKFWSTPSFIEKLIIETRKSKNDNNINGNNQGNGGDDFNDTNNSHQGTGGRTRSSGQKESQGNSISPGLQVDNSNNRLSDGQADILDLVMTAWGITGNKKQKEVKPGRKDQMKLDNEKRVQRWLDNLDTCTL